MIVRPSMVTLNPVSRSASRGQETANRARLDARNAGVLASRRDGGHGVAMRELRGSCLCREIEYSVDDDFAYMGHCHCSECRKFSGSAFSAFGGVEPAKLRFSKG